MADPLNPRDRLVCRRLAGMRATISFALLLATPACRDAWPEPPETDHDAVAAGFPRLTGRVVDEAGLLSPQQERELSSKSEALQAQTHRQFVIVTVRSLHGQDTLTYTRKLWAIWKIGRRGYNDGTILLVAPNERSVRIATGDGLAKVFPDEEAKRIVDQTILPRFREADLSGGIIAGADAITRQLTKRPYSPRVTETGKQS